MKFKIKDQEIYLDQVLKDSRKRKNHQIFQIDFQLLELEQNNQLIYHQLLLRKEQSLPKLKAIEKVLAKFQNICKSFKKKKRI